MSNDWANDSTYPTRYSGQEHCGCDESEKNTFFVIIRIAIVAIQAIIPFFSSIFLFSINPRISKLEMREQKVGRG